MFTKALILALLGSSLVVGSPVAAPDLKEWYSSAISKLQKLYVSAQNSIDDYVQKLKASAAYAEELGEDAAAYLKVRAIKAKETIEDKVNEIQEKAAAQIEKLKNKVVDTSTTGLQLIGYETDKITKAARRKIAETLEAAKKAWNHEVKAAKEKYAEEP